MSHQSDFEEPWKFTDDDLRVNDIPSNEPPENLVYIDGIAYKLESYGELNKDGSRVATLKQWIPF